MSMQPAGEADDRSFLKHYGELRAIARSMLDPSRKDPTLGATALVHEAWLRLVGAREGRSLPPEEFLKMASGAMRHTLLDHVRKHGRQKRGGARGRLNLDALDLATTGSFDDILAVDGAIEKLGALDPNSAEVVRLRFYAGLQMDEIARTVGRSERTVHRDWGFARAWLTRALGTQA